MAFRIGNILSKLYRAIHLCYEWSKCRNAAIVNAKVDDILLSTGNYEVRYDNKGRDFDNKYIEVVTSTGTVILVKERNIVEL